MRPCLPPARASRGLCDSRLILWVYMAEGLSSAASVAWDKENMNATPGKDDTSGRMPDSVSVLCDGC